jgi:hypothetical protein
MENPQLKSSLLATGDEAFLSLAQQIQHLLDLIDFYMIRWPDDEHGSISNAHKHEQLRLMINALGSLPYQFADQLRRWKNNEPRVLSVVGIEVEVLNEIWCTIEALTMFFIREEIDLEPFNLQKAQRAFSQLVRVNRLLD